MWITHSYIGTIRGRCQYLIFVLYQDYIERDMAIVREFDRALERLARNLRDEAAIVTPFPGDIESTRQSVLDKRWPNEATRMLTNTPSLLLIDKDFDDFDPSRDNWVILSIDGGVHNDEFPNMVRYIYKTASIIEDNNINLFELFREIRENMQNGVNFSNIFLLEPNVYGIGVNLIELYKFLRNRFG